MQWEKKIVEEVAHLGNTAKAKQAAMEKINQLSRPLRSLLRHRFDQSKWRQIVRPQ